MKKTLLYVPLAGLAVASIAQYKLLWALLTYSFLVPIWLLLLYHGVLIGASILGIKYYRYKYNTYKLGETVFYNLIHRNVAIVGVNIWHANLYKVRLPNNNVVLANANALSRCI